MSNSRHILVIDDEPRILRFLQNNLQLAGDIVQTAATGAEGLRMAIESAPDLVLLDLGLPDMDGIEVLRVLQRDSNLPVIILTARDDEDSMVTALQLGADDYLTKPFSGRTLHARIGAVLRRYRISAALVQEKPIYTWDSLCVDVSNRQVTLDSKILSLTPIEFALLAEFIRYPGRIRLHSDLLTAVWGPEYRDDVSILRATIYRLRQKIEVDPTHPAFIRTEAGVGYICG